MARSSNPQRHHPHVLATNTFTYNALDTRVGKVDSGGTFTYKRDGVNVTDPVINDAAASYTPGVSERRSGASKFYHGERQGSNVLETNSSQTSTATKTYDAFGMLISSSGSSSSPFGYVGQAGYQSDADSGLMLLGHRYYDSSTGRFLTRAYAKDSRTWYSYCKSNPQAWDDPEGLKTRFWLYFRKVAGPWYHGFVYMDDDETGDTFVVSGRPIGGFPVGVPIICPRGKWDCDLYEYQRCNGKLPPNPTPIGEDPSARFV